MKEIFKEGLLTSGKAVIINLLCFLVVMSLVVLGLALFAETIGYNAIGVKEEKSEALYTHYFKDGDDTRLAEYEKKGYEIQKQDLKQIPNGKYNVILIVSQFFALAIFMGFMHSKFWQKGYKDRNMVAIGEREEERLKGLKIGLVAIIIPEILIAALCLIKSIEAQLLKFIFPLFYPAMDFITKNGGKLCDLQPWKIAVIMALFLIVPLTTHISYTLGYRDFSLSEKLIYKNKKRK